MSEMSKPRSFILSAGLIFLLAILTLTVYAQVRHHEFINYDDQAYVTSNPYVLKGFSPESLRWVWTSVVCANWHPVTMLSHMLDVHFYGIWAGGHHLTHVFFHLLNGILLFLVLRKMTGQTGPSFFTAAFFLIHPLHVESVAWASERKDVLSMFFMMLTLGAYGKYCRTLKSQILEGLSSGEKNASWGKPAAFYFLTLIFYILGLMSKSMLVSVPCVLLLLDIWPLKRLEPKKNFIRLAAEKIPFFILALAAAYIAIQTQKGAFARLDYLPFKLRLANAFVSYWSYFWKTFWPSGLVAVYPHPGAMVSFPKVFGAILFLSSFSYFSFRLRKNHPYLGIGWLWFLGTLIPVIGLIQVGTQAMADRYTYIPMTGLLIAVIWSLQAFVSGRKWGKIGLTLLGTIAIAVLLPLTYRQVSYWRTSVTLFEHAAKASSRNVNALHGLALALDAQGDSEGAKRYLLQVLGINSKFSPAGLSLAGLYAKQGKMEDAVRYLQNTLEVDPHNQKAQFNLGSFYFQQKKYKEAIFYYSKILQDHPHDAGAIYYIGTVLDAQGEKEKAFEHYSKSLALKPDYPMANYRYAIHLAEKDKFGEAIPHFLKAIRPRLFLESADTRKGVRDIFNYADTYEIYPEPEEVYTAIGNIYHRLGNFKQAVSFFVKAIEINKEYAAAYYGMASVFSVEGNLDLAYSQYQSAIKWKPDYFEAYTDLAILVKKQGNLAQAIELYRKAVQLKPDDANIHYNLANALISKGEHETAEKHYLEAVRLKPDFAEALHNLGSLYKKEGKLKEAQTQYEKALLINSGYISARFNLADSYEMQGNTSSAVREYQAVLKLDPVYQSALERLKKLETARN